MRARSWWVVLLSLTWAFSARAACEHTPSWLDYQLPDQRRDTLSGERLRFRPFCAAHTQCYRSPDADREKCDSAYHESLSDYCADKFRPGSHAHGRCQLPVNESYKHVLKRGAAYFRSAQRKIARAASAKKRRDDRARRRKQRQERRAQRRRDQYRKAYEEQYSATGSPAASK